MMLIKNCLPSWSNQIVRRKGRKKSAFTNFTQKIVIGVESFYLILDWCWIFIEKWPELKRRRRGLKPKKGRRGKNLLKLTRLPKRRLRKFRFQRWNRRLWGWFLKTPKSITRVSFCFFYLLILICLTQLGTTMKVYVKHWKGGIQIDIHKFYIKDGKQMP